MWDHWIHLHRWSTCEKEREKRWGWREFYNSLNQKRRPRVLLPTYHPLWQFGLWSLYILCLTPGLNHGGEHLALISAASLRRLWLKYWPELTHRAWNVRVVLWSIHCVLGEPWWTELCHQNSFRELQSTIFGGRFLYAMDCLRLVEPEKLKTRFMCMIMSASEINVLHSIV